MYTKFFGLCEYPFGLTSDLRFFYSLPLHEEAFFSICSVLRSRQGLALLTGEPGTGKTTLLQRLTQTLGEAAQVIMLPLAAPTFAEILSYLGEQFSLPFSPRDGLGITLTSLEEYLLRVASRGSTVVLIIDEAQHLEIETLNHLRQLLRLEGAAGKLLQIVLAGQPELEEKLAQSEAQFLQQHLAAWQRLSPFPHECVGSYIRHRLAVAGCERPELFTPEAIRTVGIYSQAIPRLINVICDNALLTAYRLDLHVIPLEVIVQVAEDLHLPQPPAASNKPPTETFATSALHGAPRKMFAPLRASGHPLAWMCAGVVIGWCTAPVPFSIVQLASLSQETAQMTAAVENPSLPLMPPEGPKNQQVSQSTVQAPSASASVLPPSALPSFAEALVPQEPKINVTIPTRSALPLSSTFAVSDQPPVSPSVHTSLHQDTQPVLQSVTLSSAASSSVSSPTSQPAVSSEVARIIAILKHPISSPTSPEITVKTSARSSSPPSPARRKRFTKSR